MMVSNLCILSVVNSLAYISFVSGIYNADCSANERLRCNVEEGLCAENPQAEDYPSAPYDLRVSPYLVANPSRKPDSYQLMVNISWMPTHERNINNTIGFEANMLDKDTNRQWCFTFKLDKPHWLGKDRFESTRFRFSTVDMFDYGHSYYIEVQSLPKPFNQSVKNNFIAQEVVMPGHPERSLTKHLKETGYLEPGSEHESVGDYCSASSSHPAGAHPHASYWVAAFRYVYIQPKLRLIYVDFIAAPPQYCFEEYELRLFDSKQHLVQQARIPSDHLTHEIHDGVMVAFGNYTFHNVTVGWYEVGVLPVAYSQVDGRCLCPMPNRVCTCSLSIWPEVEMPESPAVIQSSNPCDHLPPVKLPFDCPSPASGNASNIFSVEKESTNDDDNAGSMAVVTLVCLFISAVIILAIGSLLLVMFYRRYKRKGAGRMYLLPISTTDMEMTRTGTISTEMSTILHPVKLTIIYSHDCEEYDHVVHSLVDYLNNQCLCQVSIDYLSPNEVAANKFDWAYKSIVDADHVILLNSYGSYMRYHSKLVNSESPAIVERSDPVQFDDLFLLQLELLSQEKYGATKKAISAQFPFTPDHCILPHANPHVRYELPTHFRSLIVNLHNLPIYGNWQDGNGNEDTTMPIQLRRVNMEQYDQCMEGERLRECVQRMTKYIHDDPDWFERMHVRRPIKTTDIVSTNSSTDQSIDIPVSAPSKALLPIGHPLIPSQSIDHPLLLPQPIDRPFAPPQPIDETGGRNEDGNIDPSSPLLTWNGPADHAAGQETNHVRTSNYPESMDSGVAVSSSKSNERNASPLKYRNTGLNGTVGGEDFQRRLIA